MTGQAGVIGGAQRLGTGAGFAAGQSRGDAIQVRRGQRPGGKFFQQVRGHVQEITSDHKIPVGGLQPQRRRQSAHGTEAGNPVPHHGESQMRISLRIADEGHFTRRLAEPGSEDCRGRPSLVFEKRFVAAHAAAGASRQHEARDAHGSIITDKLLENHDSFRIILKNKFMLLCFAIASAGLSLTPSRAADAAVASVVRADTRTGRLVRQVVEPRKPAPAERRAQVRALVQEAAAKHEVDPLLVHSVIETESSYNPYAVSRAGAEGLMQLMPATARELGVKNSFDPRQNIEAGVRYLKQLQEQYKDDRLALAAYNAGPAAVARYKWVPPYRETREYVAKVTGRYAQARRANPPPPAPPAAEPPVRVAEYVDAEGRLHLKTVR